MRGAPESPLTSPRPLATLLPSMLQGDDFCVRFTQGLDSVLAPALWTLDNLDGYSDPWTAPDDFLEWMASWFGWELDRRWPERRRRAVVARAVELHRWRGTVRGVSLLVELYTGARPEIVDGGGTWTTLDPSEPLPGEARDRVLLRVRPEDGEVVDERRLRRLLRAIVPSHLRVEVEVVSG